MTKRKPVGKPASGPQLSPHPPRFPTGSVRRLQKSGRRFHANDNIHDAVEPGELDLLVDEVTSRMQGVLESLVIDTESDHNTQETARRVAKMYVNEVFRGRYHRPPTVTEFPNAERLNELMIVGPDDGAQHLQPPFLSHHRAACGSA